MPILCFNKKNMVAREAFCVKRVREMFETWGSGNMTTLEQISEYFTDDCAIDATGVSNVGGYKTYIGAKGCVEWVEFLTRITFNGIKIDWATSQPHDDSICIQQISYIPEVEGRKASSSHTDLQRWTVTPEGKISAVTFFWNSPVEKASLFNDTESVSRVKEMFQAWGTGNLQTAEQISEFFSETADIDATGIPGVPEYKKYVGVQGCVEWIQFLNTMEFHNFNIDWATACPEDKNTVILQISCTPELKCVKKADFSVRDTHRWTLGPDGKITAVRFFWEKPDQMASLFEPFCCKRVREMFEAWKAGKLSTLEETQVFWTDDADVDITGVPGVEHFKKYHGAAGHVEWVEFLATGTIVMDGLSIDWAMPCKDDPNVCIQQFSYTPIVHGKKADFTCTDIQRWTVGEDGKISAVKCFWSKGEQLAAMFKTSEPVARVMAMFQAWGSGQLQTYEQMKEFFTEDADLDARGVDHPAYKQYVGAKGCVEWVQFLNKWEFHGFNIDWAQVDPTDANIVNVQISSTPELKGVKKMDGPVKDTHRWTVGPDGKITAGQFFWEQPEELAAILRTSVARIQEMVMAWGTGQLETYDQCAAFFAEDCVTDATGIPGVDGYKTYNGVQGVVDWVAFLKQIDFGGFNIDWAITMPGTDNVVVQQASYTPTVAGKTGVAVRDQHRWTLNSDMKVSHVKFFWDKPTETAALFEPYAVRRVREMHEAWGTGKLQTYDEIKEYFSEDADIDATGVDLKLNKPNKTGYSKYRGAQGCVNWVEFLSSFEFHDFNIEWANTSPNDPNTVIQQVSFTPEYNGKKADFTPHEMQRWVVGGDGKISAVKFFWSMPEEMQALIEGAQTGNVGA